MKLDDWLGRFAEVVEERDGWVVPCPAHTDSHPSLRVAVSDAGKVLLKCRAGCRTDDVLRALNMTWRDLEGVEPGDVPTRATSRDVPASPADVARLAVTLDRWTEALWSETDLEAAAVFDYARDRFGLSDDDVKRLGLGYAPVATYDADGNVTNGGLPGGPRLVVPFRDGDGVPRGYQARSVVRGAKVRWLGAKSPDGASWAKVGWLPGEAGWSEVVVTEGPGDGLTACAVGYDVVFVRGAGLADTVADEVAQLAAGRPVVVCGDADPAGDRFARKLAAALASRGIESVRKVRPPFDGDDLTDWRTRDPQAFAEEFVRAIANADDPGGLRTRVAAWTADDLTDIAAARKLKAHFEAQGSGVRYSPEAGFFILDGGVWRQDKLDAVRTHAQEVARTIFDEVDQLEAAATAIEDAGDPNGEAKAIRKQLGKLRTFAKHVNSSKGLDSMIRELQALKGVAADVNDFDRHHHLVACVNGVVNLRTGELLPHDPELLLTRKVDVRYDPNASAPRWERFLREVFPGERHRELPAYVRRLVGYGITGETAEQCFAVLWGGGANGKSVFTDTLTEVFRELTVTTPFSTFEDRGSGGIPNDLAALKGARLVMAAEGEQGRPMAEAVLKRVTGRDLISARFMRKEFFEFRPTFLLMLATNFKPQFRGQDEGLWRRVKLIPWERYFRPEERDHRLGQKLLDEREGIFAWAVRGAVEWYRDGLKDPDVIRDATAEYRQTQDALAGFLPGVMVIDPDAGRMTGKVLFDAYLQWADDENLPGKDRWTRRTFFSALEERGAIKKRDSRGVVFDGIRRARQTDAVPDHVDTDADDGTEAPPLAHSPGESPITITGPSLDDAL